MSTDNSSSALPSDVELPFALARESGRTHLQVGIEHSIYRVRLHLNNWLFFVVVVVD